MNKDEVKKLAQLSRLEISDSETEKLAGEIDSILQYIDQIQNAPIADDNSRIESAGVRNVFREDENPHQSGENTETLLKEVPETKDGLIKVKKII